MLTQVYDDLRKAVGVGESVSLTEVFLSSLCDGGGCAGVLRAGGVCRAAGQLGSSPAAEKGVEQLCWAIQLRPLDQTLLCRR